MKSMFAGVSRVMLGAVLVVGCGGAQDTREEAPTPAPAQVPAPMEPTADSQEPPPWTGGQSEPGKVGELQACCFSKCSNSPNWHGPFRGVDYGNCANYGRYYCLQHGGSYVGAKWDQC